MSPVSSHRSSRQFNMLNIKAFFLSFSGNTRESNMKIFISADDKTHIITMFVHAALTPELDYIRERLLETSMRSLTIHPLTLLVLALEKVVADNIHSSDSGYQQAANLVSRASEAAVVDFADQSRAALTLKHGCAVVERDLIYLDAILGNLIIWSKEGRNISSPDACGDVREEAGALICHRLNDLKQRVTYSHTKLRTGMAFTEVHSQSVRSAARVFK